MVTHTVFTARSMWEHNFCAEQTRRPRCPTLESPVGVCAGARVARQKPVTRVSGACGDRSAHRQPQALKGSSDGRPVNGDRAPSPDPADGPFLRGGAPGRCTRRSTVAEFSVPRRGRTTTMLVARSAGGRDPWTTRVLSAGSPVRVARIRHHRPAIQDRTVGAADGIGARAGPRGMPSRERFGGERTAVRVFGVPVLVRTANTGTLQQILISAVSYGGHETRSFSVSRGGRCSKS